MFLEQRRHHNASGESKLMCERMLERFYRAHGFAAVAFRYCNAAGSSATRGEAHRHQSHLISVALTAVSDRGASPLLTLPIGN